MNASLNKCIILNNDLIFNDYLTSFKYKRFFIFITDNYFSKCRYTIHEAIL